MNFDLREYSGCSGSSAQGRNSIQKWEKQKQSDSANSAQHTDSKSGCCVAPQHRGSTLWPAFWVGCSRICGVGSAVVQLVRSMEVSRGESGQPSVGREYRMGPDGRDTRELTFSPPSPLSGNWNLFRVAGPFSPSASPEVSSRKEKKCSPLSSPADCRLKKKRSCTVPG